MKLVLSFLPFLAFALASMSGHTELGLIAAAMVACVLLLADLLAKPSRFRLLNIGTVVLFVALAVFVGCSGVDLSIAIVRLCVDGGLSLMAVVGVLMGRPFTLDYVGDVRTSRNNISVMRKHAVVSLAWAAAFAICATADLALWMSILDARHTTLVIAGALYAAFRFTQWYPQNARRHMAAAQ
jgi:hypothetical protein